MNLLRNCILSFVCLSLLSPHPLYAQPASDFASAATEVETPSITIPEEFGSVDVFHRGTNGKTIVYIQDAHDSLQAQENIAKIITHLVHHHGVSTVFEEGFEGVVPTDDFFGIFKDPAAKEKVSYYLMDKLRLGGAEYAHINRTRDFSLIGVDSIKLHKENIDWYKKSAQKRALIEKDLEAIHKEIRVLANKYFPKDLKTWMRLKSRLDNDQISKLDYLKRIAKNNTEAYPNIDLLIRSESLEQEAAAEAVKKIDLKELF
ncbi:MAG: hypothetical protein Q8R76_08140 [Candidatus Omnitrophota bacterium]|nr:hypothetical protein [Candidatus Omnitrophota bacterium]